MEVENGMTTKCLNQKAKILDIAMNLNRIGNWAADDFDKKRKRILFFLDQTSEYLKGLKPQFFREPFKKTYDLFLKEYLKLEEEAKIGPKDKLYWAEKMMTWGNILTHRAKSI